MTREIAEFHKLIEEAVQVANEVTNMLVERWPLPTRVLETALVMVAATMARNSTVPLKAEEFGFFAQLVFNATQSGEIVLPKGKAGPAS